MAFKAPSKAPFSPRAREEIRSRYNFICSVCFQPVVSGQCAHLFPCAAEGESQVKEAKFLGLLDPHTNYDRSAAYNGTLQCPTCHLEYFTKGILVWAPPLEILNWIYKQMMGMKEASEIRQIFVALESKKNFPARIKHLSNLYSLIPIFKPKFNAKRYDLYCALPPLSMLVEGKFQTVSNPRQSEPTFRIFEYRKARTRARKATIVSFLHTHDQKERVMPTNYWKLQAPCSVILYLFILKATETSSDKRPEMVLGRQIYSYLKRVIEPPKNERGARFAKDLAAGAAGDKTDINDSEERAHHGSPTVPATPPYRRTQSEPASSQKSPRAVCGSHPAKDHNKWYCVVCQKVEWIAPPPVAFGVRQNELGEKTHVGGSKNGTIEEDENPFLVTKSGSNGSSKVIVEFDYDQALEGLRDLFHFPW
ncbi:hypothetical protein MSAN_01694000 [Mycena sanguinolenta]|uniref:Uncharacterized protein n=1 Tax=Mycena sanguinolenta TaxID=230812 RepID=A0A8H7CTD6_9AGAR|nr:hypothetical protein MSAN_01694000 [Mycena sanguinolenta]